MKLAKSLGAELMMVDMKESEGKESRCYAKELSPEFIAAKVCVLSC